MFQMAKIWDRFYDFVFAEFFGEKWAFLTENKANFKKNLIVTLVFEKNANFFAENCQKSQKKVIVTSATGVRFCENYLPICKGGLGLFFVSLGLGSGFLLWAWVLRALNR
jgi:hypothetical protein